MDQPVAKPGIRATPKLGIGATPPAGSPRRAYIGHAGHPKLFLYSSTRTWNQATLHDRCMKEYTIGECTHLEIMPMRLSTPLCIHASELALTMGATRTHPQAPSVRVLPQSLRELLRGSLGNTVKRTGQKLEDRLETTANWGHQTLRLRRHSCSAAL